MYASLPYLLVFQVEFKARRNFTKSVNVTTGLPQETYFHSFSWDNIVVYTSAMLTIICTLLNGRSISSGRVPYCPQWDKQVVINDTSYMPTDRGPVNICFEDVMYLWRIPV